MPKLPCPCGFVHNLSAIPDDAWLTIRDQQIEDYYDHMRAYQDGFDSPEDSAERKASNAGIVAASKLQGRLYECPKCGRILWRKSRDDDYQIFRPDPEAYEVEAARRAATRTNWTCPKCNEILEPQFASCWNCGTGKPDEATA